MGKLYEMLPAGYRPEVEPNKPEQLYFEFPDMVVRAEAMDVINELRKDNPEMFSGEQSYKIDVKRTDQGLELAFDSTLPGRAEWIRDQLHAKKILLNMRDDGSEEPIYHAAA